MSRERHTASSGALGDECLRWDDRYRSEPGLFFGDSPTPLVVASLELLRGGAPTGARALCLGEGEGRDALLLARAGLRVTAVDGSRVGLDKLRGQAAREALDVDVVHADLEHYTIEPARWDLVVSCYCHLPPILRRRVHAAAARGLAPGGLLVIEGFSPRQLEMGLRSGGPRDPRLLFCAVDVRADVEALVDIDLLFEGEAEIRIGRHRGPAIITQLRGRAPLDLGTS